MPGNSLIIVESPTKAKTISKIMGAEFMVLASMGHIIDLPEGNLGIDIEKDFAPSYEILAGRKKVVTALKDKAKEAECIYMATDPDREGEAIGWQIKDKLFKNKKILRVEFHEITQDAVKKAFASPRDFDEKLIEAQISRRVLDRLVGYYLSPLLWKKITRGLSAGRVQSVALRIIVERERLILKFVPQEYWELDIILGKLDGSASFKAKLAKINGKDFDLNNKEEADKLVEELKSKKFTVSDIKETEKKRSADAPFITSTLQQESFNKLHYNGAKTMMVAQQLYEGIDIGEEAPVGFITYMRTDSTNIAAEALSQCRDFILHKYGKEYLPEKPPVYKLKKLAQAAHEAIRPTLVTRNPESVKNFLTDEQYKLYELIYNRFIACQMTPSRYKQLTVSISADNYLFTSTASQMIFDGFSAVYKKDDDDDEKDKDKNIIPALQKLEELILKEMLPSQHFTKPPARFSDSSLVKILEEEGIGRPSTYAPIITTLIQRGYVQRLKGYLQPTELGFKVNDMLVEYFPEIIDIKFSAGMEDALDEVEEGKTTRVKVLKDFYILFKNRLDFAHSNIKKEVVHTSDICEKCGKPMIIKWGRKGKFLSCSDFPQCKFAKSITTGVKCPQSGCTGELVERKSKRGSFYGCSKFPECKFISKTLPNSDQPNNEQQS